MEKGARCKATTFDSLSGNDTRCAETEGHEGRHCDGCLSWLPETLDDQGWHYMVSENKNVWASNEDTDPYGQTCEVRVAWEDPETRDEILIRVASNERATPTFKVQVGAPVTVIAEVLRKLGWTVIPPPPEKD